MSVDDELGDLVKQACATALRENRQLIREECRAALQDLSGKTIAAEQSIDTKDAAEIAGVKPTTIRNWVRSGRLRALGERPYRFEIAEVVRARDRRPNSTSVVDFEARAVAILDRRDTNKGPK